MQQEGNDVRNHSLAHGAYQQVAAPIRTVRGTEYEVVARVTHRLKTAAIKGKSGFPDLVSALHDNQKLWSAFALDVADPENALPKELRAQIFYLAEFTFEHTRKILGGTAEIAPLLDINTAVMRGLRGPGQPG